MMLFTHIRPPGNVNACCRLPGIWTDRVDAGRKVLSEMLLTHTGPL